MVSPSQLASWQPARLTEIAEEVLRNRRVLTGLHDELDRGAPPASWTFTDATRARAEHHRLAGLLATQVSETVGVIDALDTAAAAITSAMRLLEGAMRRAGNNGLNIDHATGRVTVVRTFDDEDDLAHARTVRNEVSEQIETALRDADAADQALAAVLDRAATTDVNDVGSLAQQQALLDFQKLSPADQVSYLLEHPEAYALLGDHVPDAVRTRIGESIASDIDEMARDPELLDDPAKVAEVTRLLSAFGGDPDVAAPLYQKLGADGLLGTFGALSQRVDADLPESGLGALAEALRTGLQSATRDEDFDGEAFGTSMVRYATGTASDAAMDAYGSTYRTPLVGTDGTTLDFLLRGEDYGEDFVRGVVWELDRFETTEPLRAEIWRQELSTQSPLAQLGVDASDRRLPDPMAAAMGQLGDHPALGLEFFTEDEDRYAQYFTERDWSRDGFEGIARAALGIGTDPENLAHEAESTATLVSEFVDRIPDNSAFGQDTARAAVEPIADLLKHYMPAVGAAIVLGGDDDFAARVTSFDTFAYLSQREFYPEFDQIDLDRLTKVALSTDEGMARIAEGVASFRQSMLVSFAGQHPGVEGAAENAPALQDLMDRAAAVDGYMQNQVAHIAIDGAHSRDQQVAAFTGLVSKAVGVIPVPFSDEIGEIVGGVGKKAWDTAWGQVREIPVGEITETFGSSEAAVRQAQEGDAIQGQQRMTIASFLSLADAGLVEVPVAMQDTWLSDDGLISLDQLSREQIPTFAREAHDAMGASLSVAELKLSYKDPFVEWVYP